MENKKTISDNLKNEAPFLSKIEKINHFSTPNNYFEVLPEVISSKNVNTNKLQFLFDKLSYKVLVPISMFAVLLFIVFNMNSNSIEEGLTNEQLCELILEEVYIEIDDYLVYESYAELIEEDEIDTSTDTEEYINYLLENDIDINSIIEEL
ncbi:MAG: hypothetical protein COA97_01690 [Flavobacteriales bacterium]|nr:MAG: hypothetical protein COA97_01690 [Flavobacteriales bacterium]